MGGVPELGRQSLGPMTAHRSYRGARPCDFQLKPDSFALVRRAQGRPPGRPRRGRGAARGKAMRFPAVAGVFFSMLAGLMLALPAGSAADCLGCAALCRKPDSAVCSKCMAMCAASGAKVPSAPVARPGKGPSVSAASLIDLPPPEKPAPRKTRAELDGEIQRLEKSLRELSDRRLAARTKCGTIPADEPYPDQVRQECAALDSRLTREITEVEGALGSLKTKRREQGKLKRLTRVPSIDKVLRLERKLRAQAGGLP